jgi:predicted HicB family RNase H-like nuclease|nr:MAG TPA: antitoxin [Caudoviricetes sp.]
MTSERMRFTLRLPENLLTRLGKASNELGVSINSLIIQILWDYVKEVNTYERT